MRVDNLTWYFCINNEWYSSFDLFNNHAKISDLSLDFENDNAGYGMHNIVKKSPTFTGKSFALTVTLTLNAN